MASLWPLTLGISGPSKSGKTTLIESLIPHLVARFWKVLVLKRHCRPIDLDTPGKDSYRFYQAKADVLFHDGKQALYRFQEQNLLENLLRILPGYYDLILVEGNKSAYIPKIWLQKECPLSPEHEVLTTLDEKEKKIEWVLPWIVEWMENAWKRLPLGMAFVTQKNTKFLSQNLVLAKKYTKNTVIVSNEAFCLNNTFCLPLACEFPFPFSAVSPLFRFSPQCCWLVFYGDYPVQDEDISSLLSQAKPGIWKYEEKNRGLYYPQIYHLWDKIFLPYPQEAQNPYWEKKMVGNSLEACQPELPYEKKGLRDG